MRNGSRIIRVCWATVWEEHLGANNQQDKWEGVGRKEGVMAVETYEDALKDLQADHERQVKHLKACAQLFPVAAEYAKEFSDCHKYNCNNKRYSSVTYAVGLSTINGVGLNLYLGEDDTIKKDAMMIITKMILDRRLKPTDKKEPEPDVDYKVIDYYFTDADGNGRLIVRIWWRNSTRCQLIPTGEKRDIMKVVCEEA